MSVPLDCLIERYNFVFVNVAYTVHVDNVLGPSAPRNVQVQVSSSTSIDVTWEMPAVLNGILQKYIVSYGTRRDYQDIFIEVTNQTFERKLSSLKKFTTYFIKVRGQTTKTGNASRVFNATTFEDRK